MSLIQEAKITFQQFEKWIIFFCLTSIFKMELKREILIFRYFASHTLCKYVHHHVLHLSRPKTAWSKRCPAWNAQCGCEHSGGVQSRTVINTSMVPGYMDISMYLRTIPEYWEETHAPCLILHQTQSIQLNQSFPVSSRSISTSTTSIQASNIPGNTAMLPQPPASVLCSNSYSTPPGRQLSFLSISLDRLFHSDYRLKFE